MDTYLSHHGILGMKWGVRRYQNKDGTLTPEGKARARKVEGSNLASRRDTKDAIKITKRVKRDSEDWYRLHSYTADKNYEKMKKSTNVLDAEKYQNKAKTNYEKAQSYLKQSKVAQERLDEISSGTLKAGRDFIIQRDYDFYPIGPILIATSERRYIETNKRG